MRKKINPLDLPRVICHHIVGEHHTIAHRMVVGVVIIFVGTSIAQIHTVYAVVNLFNEAFGFVMHGIGSLPIVELVLGVKKQNKEDENV